MLAMSPGLRTPLLDLPALAETALLEGRTLGHVLAMVSLLGSALPSPASNTCRHDAGAATRRP